MEFRWSIFVPTAVVNTSFMVLIFIFQYLDKFVGKGLPLRRSTIDETGQEFLYVQDFRVMKYGDTLGLVFIINAFVHLVFEDLGNLWWGLGIGFIGSLAFLKYWLGEDHRRDYAFPDIGRMSWAGALHQLYFAIGLGASAICAWKLFSGELRGPVMWFALAGFVFYLIVRELDVREGHFDPPKKHQGLQRN